MGEVWGEVWEFHFVPILINTLLSLILIAISGMSKEGLQLVDARDPGMMRGGKAPAVV